MFSHTIVDETRSAPDVVLVAVVTCDLVNDVAGGGAGLPGAVYALWCCERELV